MYDIECVDVGSSKDPFSTQVSEFTVLFGNELDAEVCCHIFLLDFVRKHNVLTTFFLIGVIDVNGSLCRSNHVNIGISCLQGVNRYYRKPG